MAAQKAVDSTFWKFRNFNVEAQMIKITLSFWDNDIISESTSYKLRIENVYRANMLEQFYERIVIGRFVIYKICL